MLLKRFICATVLYLVPAFAKTISYSDEIPCESGSYFFGEKCYKRFADRVRDGSVWTEAAKVCKAKHGSLVTIDTKELQDFLTAFILLQLKLNVWIGLNDREVESVYEWDDGSAVNYTNWGPDEPTGVKDEKEDCVELRYQHHGETGVWNDVPCTYLAPFICQYNKGSIWSHDSRFCPISKGGGFKYANSCYHVVLEEKPWDDAETYCQEKFKGHLLTIFNPMEEIFLNYVLSEFDKEFWIGIKIDEATQLVWTSGWHTVYNNWSDEFKILLNGTCAAISTETRWTSAPCFEIRPFICEVSSDKPAVVGKSPEGGRCPDESEDWRDLGGDKCWTFENKHLKWDDANAVCMKKGGTLAVIESKEESDALLRYVEPHTRMFFGLRRNSTDEDVFEWVNGTAYDYKHWRKGEPCCKDEKCVELWTDNMEWNDVSCDNKSPFICSARKIIVDCSETTHGCCADGKSAAEGPGNVGCPTIVMKSCNDAIYGCCPDGKAAAKGPDQTGCPMIAKHSCEDTAHGCCPDGKTAAENPDQAGCPMIVNCTDDKTAAEGSGMAGCRMIVQQSCAETLHGCCPDGKTVAEGPGNAGCPRNKSYMKVLIGILVCAIVMIILLVVVVYYIRYRNAKQRKYSTELEIIT